MRFAIASIACLSAAVLAVAVRGAADWSRSFATTWYALFGAAVLLAVVALVAALVEREASLGRRLAIVSLALPALLAVPALLWVIATLAPLAD